jgi:hypothetical protein
LPVRIEDAVRRVTLAACVSGTVAISAAASASAYSSKVEDACRDDYFRHCSSYPVNSAALRLCMESKSNSLSQTCIRALIDSGMVDRRRLKRAGN